MLAGSALVIGCGSGDLPNRASEPTISANATPLTAPAAAREVVVEVDIPAGTSLSELAVAGNELKIGAGARLRTPAGKYAGVAHTGVDAARVGRDVQLGTLLSVGDVELSDGVHVHGDLRTRGIVGAPPTASYTVDGVTAQADAVPLRKLTRRAPFGPNAAAVRVAPRSPTPTLLAPGAYASADVLPGSELVLRSGDYYFDELAISPGAKLTIDDRGGSVFVYVGKDVRLNGTIAGSSGHPRWLLSYLGTSPVVLSRAFSGALIAPSASIVLGSTPTPHNGSFYAKDVHVQPGAHIVHRTMPWIIGSVTFDKPAACPGDTVELKVNAPDPTNPAARATVTIDGAPIDQMFDQVLGGTGTRVFAISATASDGTRESRLERLPLQACPSGQAARPILLAQPNPLVPDAVAFTVMNAPSLGAVSYTWEFGDGTTVSGPSPAVNHTFADVAGSTHAKFDVTVTVKRVGTADAYAKRTFVVWSSYELSRARGLLEPPTVAVDPLLKASVAGLGGEIEFTNREADVLTYDRRRVDLVPCNGDDPITVGGDASTSVVVPAKGSLRVSISVPATSLTDKTCGIVVHHWGATASGTKAHVAVQFDRASKLGKGAPVDPKTTAVLNYLVKSGSLTAGKRVTAAQLVDLYRARQIPQTALTPLTPLGGTDDGILRGPCNPEDSSPPPLPGFSCQPTGKWELATEGVDPSTDRVMNAFKGDSVLVRGCDPMLAPLLGRLNPPQLFTHMGIMTKHRSQLVHSTGDVDYLIAKHPNGTADLPSDGFKENGLRYLWPGTIEATVREAFITNRLLTTPEGEKLGVGNFGRNEVRCHGDTQVVFPLVLKPDPAFETKVRGQLMAAADAAKNIHGHYRFASYSQAPDAAVADPKAPAPVPDTSPLGPSTGPVPTVCSSFVRFALKAVGFELDRNKSVPRVGDVRGGAADGLFFYDAEERRAAADMLYAGLHAAFEQRLGGITAETDDYWWKTVIDPAPGAMGFLGVLSPPSTTGTLIGWATDAPDDVANQVTNCFASDFCSEDAKDSDAWNEPGTGVAVGPDDMLNHYDSPQDGGPYGHSERMIFRGPDFRPSYEWRPIEGSLPVKIRVLSDGKPVEGAMVRIPGFLTTPVVTNSEGRVLIEGVPRGNLLLEAQKFFPEPAPGQLRDANTCYVPADKTSNDLLLVDCADFSKVLASTPVSEATVTLKPPREEFRKVIISAKPRLEDCDCGSSNDIQVHSIYKICNLSPLPGSRTASVNVGADDLCSDEIGVSFEASCTLESDNRTVRVTGRFKLFEDVAHSCGADDLEDEKSFDVRIGPGATTDVSVGVLYNWDVCGLASCNDTANINEFKISNQVAD